MAKSKLSSQQKLTQEIHKLLSEDLGYICGDKESGPNGNKKIFLDKSARFLRQLAKDLNFQEFKVRRNNGGIAISGEITLYGIWGNDNGVMFELTQALLLNEFLYRTIDALNDYRGGYNQWIGYEVFERGDYESLLSILLKEKGVLKNVA